MAEGNILGTPNVAQLLEQRRAAQETASADVIKAQQAVVDATSPGMTNTQAIASIVTALAPVLIGAALKGKKGASIGAQAGLLGSTVTMKQIEKAQESVLKRAEADEKEALAAQLAAGKSILGLEEDIAKKRFGTEESLRLARLKESAGLGNTGTDIIMKSPDVDFEKAVSSSVDTVGILQDAISFAEENLRKEDGGFVDVAGRKINELKPESVERTFASKLTNAQLLLIMAIQRGVATEQDQARLERATAGGKFASLSTIVNNLKSTRDRLKSGLETRFRTKKTGGGIAKHISFNDFISQVAAGPSARLGLGLPAETEGALPTPTAPVVGFSSEDADELAELERLGY